MALPLHHVAFHHPNEVLEESDTEMSCRHSPKTRTQAAVILNKKYKKKKKSREFKNGRMSALAKYCFSRHVAV